MVTRSIRIAAVVFALLASHAAAAPARPAPALPAPTGAIVNVSTEAQLRASVSGLHSNTTIVMAPGTYVLTTTLYINGTFTNVGLRGATGNADDVVLAGPGMTNDSLQFGVWVGGNVQGVTIADMTIRDISNHPIVFNAGTQSPLVHNVHLVNAGQQFVKSNPTGTGGGVDNGVVEYSVIEFETTSRDDYTNGVDVHTGRNWIIRHNLFRNIRAPGSGPMAGPAVLMWNGSANSIVEGNTFINCQREIAFGLVTRTPDDHSGGLIRNNFIYRDTTLAGGDVSIGVFDSPGTRVLHNTVIASGSYPSRIEYRFPDTTGVVIANNLLDGAVQARDGASGAVSNNVTTASRLLFVNAPLGDLHLTAAAAPGIAKVPFLPDASTDFDADARPQGSVADVGADEYRSSPAVVPTIALSATSVESGGVVTVTVADGPGFALDWVGVYATTDDDTTFQSWRYLSGTQSPPGTGLAEATFPVTMPTTAGAYNLRLFQNNGFTLLAASATVTVGAPPTLGVSTTTVASAGMLMASVAGGPGFALDWVGVYGTVDSDLTYQSWQYLNGTQTPPVVGLTDAAFPVAMPATPGLYNLRLFRNNGSTRLATSTTVTVGTPPTVSVTPTTVAPGGVVMAEIEGAPGFVLDWVGVHEASASDSEYESWEYLSGTQTPPDHGLTNATLAVAMPATPGVRNLRLFQNNGSTRLATSAAITVAAPSVATIAVSTTTVSPGDVVTATIGNSPGYALDWLGVYGTGDSDSAYQSWRYLSGTQTPPDSPVTAASFAVTMPTTPGPYDLRLFQNNGLMRVATSTTITVGPPPSLGVGPTTVAAGGVVTTTVTGGPGYALDWVGVYGTGDPDLTYQSWRYLSGTQVPPASPLTDASFTVTMPVIPGTYNLRLFRNNGSTWLATSETVTVTP